MIGALDPSKFVKRAALDFRVQESRCLDSANGLSLRRAAVEITALNAGWGFACELETIRSTVRRATVPRLPTQHHRPICCALQSSQSYLCRCPSPNVDTSRPTAAAIIFVDSEDAGPVHQQYFFRSSRACPIEHLTLWSEIVLIVLERARHV